MAQAPSVPPPPPPAPAPETPAATPASDLLVAEIARRAGRATDDELVEAIMQQRAEAAQGRRLSLGQLLLKKKKLLAEEFLEVNRRLEAPLLRCPQCGGEHSARELDATHGAKPAEDARCLDCEKPLDLAAAARAIPDESLLWQRAAPLAHEPGPITRMTAAVRDPARRSGAVPTVPSAAAPAPPPNAASSDPDATLPLAAPPRPEAVPGEGSRSGKQRLPSDLDAFTVPESAEREPPRKAPPPLSEPLPDEGDFSQPTPFLPQESVAPLIQPDDDPDLAASDDGRPRPSSAHDDEDEEPVVEDHPLVRPHEEPRDDGSVSVEDDPGDDVPIDSRGDADGSEALLSGGSVAGAPGSGQLVIGDSADETLPLRPGASSEGGPRTPAPPPSSGTSQRRPGSARTPVGPLGATPPHASPAAGIPQLPGSPPPSSRGGSGIGSRRSGPESRRSGPRSASQGSTDPLGAAPEPGLVRAILNGEQGSAGKRFDRFEILATLGVGGMGVVYKARQVDLDRVVALKVLREGEGARGEQIERFQREARAAAKIQHPHIVAIHEVGVYEGVHFFTMDFVEGETLHDELRRPKRRPPLEMAKLMAVIARAVHFAHERGIVHRDLKPGNIMLAKDGTPKVTDFGLAKTIGGDELLTVSGVAIGTPLYMSPEQVKGDLKAIDGRSDVFSLGTLLYQCLTGKTPFDGESHVELYNRILGEEPVPPRALDPKIPRDLEVVCLKALEKRPQDRYPTALALAEDLERAVKGEPIEARPPGGLERLVRLARRNSTVLAVAGTALLVAGIGVSLTLHLLARQREEADTQERARVKAEADGLLADAKKALDGGRPREAAEAAALLAARHPGSEAALAARLVQADAARAQDRPEDALAGLAQVLRAGPDEGSRLAALVRMATLFAERGEDERAALAWRKVRERAGPGAREAALADLALGELHAEHHRTLEAREHLERALAAKAAGGDALLGADERRRADAALAWLAAISPSIELPGAPLGAVGDVDGDGRPELVIARGSRLLALAIGAAGAREVARGDLASDAGVPCALSLGDLDGDGRAEVLLATRDARGHALLALSLAQAGSATAAPAEGHVPPLEVRGEARFPGRLAAAGLSLGDIDGDGRAEVVAAVTTSEGAPALALARRPPAGALAITLVGTGEGGAGGAGGSSGVSGPGGRPAVPMAVLAADLEKDGKAEVVLALGDEVRVLRAGADGTLELVHRQRTGPVTALAADDMDGDGEKDLALGRSRSFDDALRRDDRLLPDGLHLARPDGGGRGLTIPFRAPFDGLALRAREARVLSLATGDLTSSGAAALAAVIEEPSRAPLGSGKASESVSGAGRRQVVVLSSFPRAEGGRVTERRLIPPRAPSWVRIADLDADGDAELIIGGPDGVLVLGAKGTR